MMFVCLVGLVAAVQFAAPAATRARRPAAPYAPASTMAQRIKTSDHNNPLKVDSLIFPNTNARNILPGPTSRPAGTRATRYPDADMIIWRTVPWVPKHAEYISLRAKAGTDKEIDRLIGWCRRNRLPVCAEYELRLMLRKIRSFQKPKYQTYRKVWYPMAMKTQTKYAFALPVSGEWYVVPDRTGHHRIKAGAAFAHDLIIRKGRKSYSGTGKQLEDHYAWGQPILAQADGVVTMASDRSPDMPIGRSGGFNNANYVSVYYGAGITGFYGHIKKGSLKVRPREKVKKGQPLALVGNSGASGAPHLHFTMTDMSAVSVKGLYAYEVKRGTRWLKVSAKDLPPNQIIRPWDPPQPTTKPN
jgi:hypothetical protein